MTASRDGIRLKTFDELFQSDMTFLTDAIFRNFFINSGDVLQFRMQEIEKSFYFSKIIGSNIAVIAECKALEQHYYFSSYFDLASYFYILPERIMKFHEKINLAFGSPFYDYLQLQHDRIFEAGLREHFRRLLVLPMIAQQNREIAYIANERYLLSLDDIDGVFILLLVGHGISLMIFVIEVVFNNFDDLKISFRRGFRKVMQFVRRIFKI